RPDRQQQRDQDAGRLEEGARLGLALEIGDLVHRQQAEPLVVADRRPEPVAVGGRGGAELHAGDAALAPGAAPQVVDVDPDLALGGAAAGGEQADDPVGLVAADPELLAEPGPPEAPGEVDADQALAPARLEVAAADDREVRPQ